MINKNKRVEIKKRIIIGLSILEVLICIFFFFRHALPAQKSVIEVAHPTSSHINKQNIDKSKKVGIKVKNTSNSKKSEINNYIKTISQDKNTSVSFYNLDDKKGQYHVGELQSETNQYQNWSAENTYQLFISAFLFDKEMHGKFDLTPERKMAFQRMIINDDNTFANLVIQKYGKPTINNYIKSQGWYYPTFGPQKVVTNSHSLMLAMQDLAEQKGAFKKQSNQKYFMSLLSKKNKGQLIFHNPNVQAEIIKNADNQRYILVVMSKNNNPQRLKDITQHFQKIMTDK